MTEPEHDVSAPSRDGGPTLELRPLLLQMVGALGLLTFGGLGVVWLLHDVLDTLGIWFVTTLGPWGVALAFGVPDMTGLPFPPDSLVMLALSGGISFWTCVAYGSVGSIVGGTLGYLGSRVARRIPWIEARLEHRAAEMEVLVSRYGVGALAAGALTPLPYSLVAWACGLLGMPFRTFLLVSLLRFLRVGLYALPLVWALGQG